MATNAEKINTFAQSVYLARSNKYFDDITSDDGVIYVNQTIDWFNQFLDEVELEADWNYLRQNEYELGTVSIAAQTFDLPSDVRKLVVDEYRPLLIIQDSSVVSEWDVVPPKLISVPRDFNTNNRVTVVNNTIVFSRELNENEIGGTVVADVITWIPRLSATDVRAIEMVKPKQLLILGVAKNATLPDIVQGGTSPAIAQKYKDLLDQAKAENEASSVDNTVGRDDYGYIGG